MKTMARFHIYEQLSKLSQEPDRPKEIDDKCRATIHTLPREHRDIFYALMLHHWILENRRFPEEREMIYNSKLGSSGNGVTVDVQYLPSELQAILRCYLDAIAE